MTYAARTYTYWIRLNTQELRNKTQRKYPKSILGARIKWPCRQYAAEYVCAETRGPREYRATLTAALRAMGYRDAEVIPEEAWPYWWY